MLCHHAKVAKTFWCCSHRLCFLQCDWWKEISLQKVINVNEARGIGWMSPDPLLSRVESAHETMVWREKVCCNSPSLLSSTHDLYTTRQSVKSQSNETIHTQRGGGGGRTRSRAANIADVAFISLWYLHRAKKHMVATNGCVPYSGLFSWVEIFVKSWKRLPELISWF